GHALEVLDFLGDVEAVEEHHRRRALAPSASPLGMHQQGGEGGSLERDLDVLYARARGLARGVAEAVHAALVGLQPLALGLEEALADVVVVRRAEQHPRCCSVSSGGEMLAPGLLDGFALARPLAEPGLVVADVVFQPQPDAVHFPDFRPAPGGGVETYE